MSGRCDGDLPFVGKVIIFAIVFPLLSWLLNRMAFSWLGSLIAVAIFAALMAVFTDTDIAKVLSGL
jgi:hypothetical protein